MAFIFNANQMTPEEVKRQREIADLLARETASGASNVGQGYARIGQGILSALLRNRADSAERKGIEGVNAKFSATMDPILQRMFEGPKSQPASPGQGAKVSPTGGSPDIVAYIREAAAKRGIDPDTAVAVARSEGLNANPADGWQSNVMRNGKRENSFGPFQLYTDGGLGNEFQKATGLDPRNPDTWRQQVDFSLDAARKGGWGPWNGAKAIGLDPWAGINRGAPVPTGGQPDTVQQGGQTVPAPRSPGFTIQDNRGPSVAPSQEMPPPQVPQQPDPNNPANQQQMGQVAAQAAGMSQQQIMQGAAQQIDALPMKDIMELYSNPYLNDGQRGLLDMVVKSKLDRGEWRSLGNGYIFNSQTGEGMKVGGSSSDARAKLGLQPQYGVDENNNPVLLQMGDNGEAVQTRMPKGVKLSKEPIKIDAGTSFILLDPITRQPVGQIPKDVAGEAAAKKRGEETGGAQSQAPAAAITAEQTVKKIDELLSDPNLGNISGIESWLPDAALATWSGSGALGLRRRVEQLQGTAFLEAYNGLRGGGQITVVEGKKAEDAMARLATAQNDADYVQALKDFRDAVVVGYQKLAARAGGQAPALTIPPPPSGPTSIDDLVKKYGG